MENWHVAVLVLVSVLVGAVLPVLWQLRSTLRATQVALEGTLPKIEASLADVAELVGRASHAVAGFQSTTSILGAIGASIGPAIVAGMTAYRAVPAQAAEEADDEQETRIKARA